MASNPDAKKFEDLIHEAFLQLPNAMCDRLYDTMNGFKTIANPCDYIGYKFPINFHIECKSCHGNTLPWTNISETQWESLYKYDKLKGEVAGYMIWFIDRDVTIFVPASEMVRYTGGCAKYKDLMRDSKKRSFNIKDCNLIVTHLIKGKKKRKFFEYDLSSFYEWALRWANK